MTFDEIAVNFDELQQASRQFMMTSQTLEGLLSQVQGQIESLGATWQGQASTDFATLMSEWTRDTQGIREVLALVSQRLSRANTLYQDADQGVAHGFRPD